MEDLSKVHNDYNYPHFKAHFYNFENFTGLEERDKFIDFELRTAEGKPVKISDFLDKPLVLETGSATCPKYAMHVKPMEEIVKKYPEFNFIVLYVRQAHPGNKIQCHTTLEGKIGSAKEAIRFYKDYRIVLVDDIDGKAHKVYGTLPNSIYVIGTDGVILFANANNSAKYLSPVLENIKNNKPTNNLKYRPAQPGLYQSWVTLYKKGGYVSLRDFILDLPKLLWQHYKAGDLF
ncbi:MAG: deiodinase-like protein [Thermonemataceae bacterium]